MDRLIGIIREGGALTARLARQRIAPDFGAREAVAQAAEAGGRYEIVERPLDALDPALFTLKVPLLAAWDALGRVQELTADVRAALRLTLAETVPGRPPSEPLPPLALGQEESGRRVRPTAAHPRAYQGTTHKPPKEKSPAPTDLRSFLYGTQHLSFLAGEEAEAAREARLPELFRTSLYPLMRCQSVPDLSETLALYWALGLQDDPARLAAATFLFSLQSGRNTYDWCRLVASLSEGHWTPLLHLLLASGAYAVSVEHLPPAFVEHLTEVLNGTDPLYRAHWLLHGLTTDIAPEYLMAGFRLADAHGQSYAFHAVQRSDYFPLTTVLQWGAHCCGSHDFFEGQLLRLWEQCGLRPGLGKCLEQIDWTQYTPDAACRCLRLYGTSWDNWAELSEGKSAAKWQAVRPLIGAFHTVMQSVPPKHQEKCVWHLIEYLWQWDTPEELAANLPSAYRLMQRLCRPPFAERNDPTEVTTDFLAELPHSLRERFLNAPDTSFRRLEEACRRENDTRLIGRGTYTLTRSLPDFSVRCFEHYPALLFKVAKLLGCLPLPVREAVTTPFQESPIFTDDLAALSLADAAELVEAYRDPGVFYPIPPKLREHLAGTRMLSPVSLAHTAGQMGTQALRTGLEMLERAGLRTLGDGYAVKAEVEPVRHALQMERLADENRRALRKFLRAHWDGQASYIEDHPQTRHWLAGHPRLDLDVWLRGVDFQQELDGIGWVTLATERDPLEALKLGTHVGSCLGLGGNFAYSAAAVALDINKQVVYARDARGTVLARQLVALAEDDRLVCFSVYPLGVTPAMELLFAEYDRRLSQALGLPLHDPDGGDEYEIAHVLSHDWWDDCAWDLTVGEG